jgi:hypothetical protein
MSQNAFSLTGILAVEPGAVPELIEFGGFAVPYVIATVVSGPLYAGECHPVYLTGEAAKIAYEELKRHPDGFAALAQGSLKTFAGQTRPWVTHLQVFEPRDPNWLIALLLQPGKLAVLIVKHLGKAQVRVLVEEIAKASEQQKNRL